jgi:hypothetical protein
VVAAEIDVDYHGVRFSLVTRNPKRRPDWLAVRLEKGPFRRFEGDWRLTALAPGRLQDRVPDALRNGRTAGARGHAGFSTGSPTRSSMHSSPRADSMRAAQGDLS